MAIMAVQKKATGSMALLSRDQCLHVFKQQQELQLEMIDEIMSECSIVSERHESALMYLGSDEARSLTAAAELRCRAALIS